MYQNRLRKTALMSFDEGHFMTCDFNNTCFLLNKKSSLLKGNPMKLPMPKPKSLRTTDTVVLNLKEFQSVVDFAFAVAKNRRFVNFFKKIPNLNFHFLFSYFNISLLALW